ncbi:DUF6438 domain-containing protein [Pontibacter litorisediminis]|uniref:DUF6438 domain-containing protein n=1 Tax=Pontibacter litorisediminis TaxID=1846260 RepID=UPI0023EDC18E|nr:DUF6438 domain-containing protein [Pontibacter litorisediminis]
MKAIILLVSVILLGSCSQQQEIINGDVHASEIKGYWEGEQQFFVVWDSIMLYPTKRTSGFHTYTLTDDLLTVNNNGTSNSLKLLKLNKDSLVLEQVNKILRYSRAKPVNPELEFSTINFSTGPCEGNCPVFDLTINENGQVEYVGKLYSEKSGEHHGQLPQQLLKNLNELLSHIDFQKVSKNQLPPPADNQQFELRIRFKNNQAVQVKNGKADVRYKTLLNVLYNLVDIIELKNKTP